MRQLRDWLFARVINEVVTQAQITRRLIRIEKENVMGAIADAVNVLQTSVDAASQSATSEIARVEALIATLQGNPDDPAVVAQVQALQAKADALKAALDAERP